MSIVPPHRPTCDELLPLLQAALAGRGFATLGELTAATNAFPVDVLGVLREMEAEGVVERVAGWRGKGGTG